MRARSLSAVGMAYPQMSLGRGSITGAIAGKRGSALASMGMGIGVGSPKGGALAKKDARQGYV